MHDNRRRKLTRFRNETLLSLLLKISKLSSTTYLDKFLLNYIYRERETYYLEHAHLFSHVKRIRRFYKCFLPLERCLDKIRRHPSGRIAKELVEARAFEVRIVFADFLAAVVGRC